MLYARLLRQAQPYWLHLAALFVVSLLSIPLALLIPLPVKIAVDNVISSHSLPGFFEAVLPAAATRSGAGVLVFAALLLVSIALLEQIQGLFSSLLRTYLGEKLVLTFRAQLFHHAQRLSFSYHDRTGAFDASYRIQYDAPAIQWVLIDGIIPFATAALTLSGMIYVTATIDWQLALVALGISPVLIGVSRAYSRRLRGQWHEFSTLHSSAMAVVQEALATLRVVSSFGREDHEEARFLHRSRKGLWARLRVDFTQGRSGLLVGLTLAMGTGAVLVVGTRHVQAGTLTLGQLLVVVAYLGQLYGPLETLSRMTAHLQRSLASAERAFALLDEVPDVAERQEAKALPRTRGAVTFRNVSFRYSKDRSILHDISFDVSPGTRVGIAGATGAGKTTLVSLLTRFYDPTDGAILLDGVDLRDYKLADLRKQFGIHLQEPVLFSASIFENIAYARPDASYEEVVAAAKAANAHEFILRQAERYETPVGERGMRLSGGERQRISIARAFLKDAPILVLDEPTSLVDAHTEAAVLEAIQRLVRGRTTFIVAHHLGAPELRRAIDARRWPTGLCEVHGAERRHSR